MKKEDKKFHIKIPVSFLFIFLCCISGGIKTIAQEERSQFGNFPFLNSFMDGTIPSYVDIPGTENSAIFTSDGVQLTPNENSKFGAIFLNDRHFTSKNGIIIEFEYMSYGSSTNEGGDGISMFLFDAATQNPEIGTRGSGLGYAYNWIDTVQTKFNSLKQRGLTGAYMGVGFDVYGNSKAMRFQGESKVNGIAYWSTSGGFQIDGYIAAAYNTKNQVTIRGAEGAPIDTTANGTRYYMPKGYTGYPVLITQSTNEEHGYVKADDSIANYLPITYSGNKFPISSGAPFTSDSDSAYRKAIVELYPVPSSINGGGFFVTVMIQHGRQLSSIINDYHYRESFYYQENALISSNNNWEYPTTTPPKYLLDATVPDSLRIGFAASTGDFNNLNIIKNVKIILPRSAEANDDSLSITYPGVAEIFPYTNDLAYEGVIHKIQNGSPTNIDSLAFRFIRNNSIVKVAKNTTSVEYQVAGEGMWRYDANTGKVTFTPERTFRGKAVINYDIKGKKDTVTLNAGPYEDEAYRSLPATISVNVTGDIPPTPVCKKIIISNRMISTRTRNSL